MIVKSKLENGEEYKYDVMISFQFSGIPDNTRQSNLKKIESKFKGKKVFCSENLENFFKQNKMTADEIYEFCLEEQKKTEEIVFFIGYERPSSGMKKELDLAKELKQKGKIIIFEGLETLPWVQEFIDFCGEGNVIITKRF